MSVFAFSLLLPSKSVNPESTLRKMKDIRRMVHIKGVKGIIIEWFSTKLVVHTYE